MGWREWCLKTFPTYPWQTNGCRLILPQGVDFKTWEEVYQKKFSHSQGVIGGRNQHDDGRYILERGEMKWDIPFWAVKYLVFERDKKCQGCNRYARLFDGEEITNPTPTNPHGLEVHHIIAVSKGGSNCTHNVVLLCTDCHNHFKLKGGAPNPSIQLSLRIT